VNLAHLSFVTVCIVWGTTYLGIHVALETIPVLLVAGLRWMAAGVIRHMAWYVSHRMESRPRPRD